MNNPKPKIIIMLPSKMYFTITSYIQNEQNDLKIKKMRSRWRVIYGKALYW